MASLPTFAELVRRYEDHEWCERVWKLVEEGLRAFGITQTREQLGLVGDPRKLRDHGYLLGEHRVSEGKKPPYPLPDALPFVAYLESSPKPGPNRSVWL